MKIELQENLPCFNEYFYGRKYDDSFGYSLKWNKEVEKWLAFIKQKDKEFYEKYKNRTKKAKQRDELLGEYKAAYFIEKKQDGEVLKFEPKGADKHDLDFCYKDTEGKEWFAEVKSPSWRNEVAKNIEDEFLKGLCTKTIFYGLIRDGNNYKSKFSTFCSVCKTSIEFTSEKLDNYGLVVNEEIKNIKCPKCKNTLWNLLEVERAKQIKDRLKKPQFINGEMGLISIESAIKYGVEKSLNQFIPNRNNILIITPNMFSETVGFSKLFNGEMIHEIVNKLDKQKVISSICILEIELRGDFEYKYNFIDFDK